MRVDERRKDADRRHRPSVRRHLADLKALVDSRDEQQVELMTDDARGEAHEVLPVSEVPAAMDLPLVEIRLRYEPLEQRRGDVRPPKPEARYRRAEDDVVGERLGEELVVG